MCQYAALVPDLPVRELSLPDRAAVGIVAVPGDLDPPADEPAADPGADPAYYTMDGDRVWPDQWLHELPANVRQEACG
jgi:hypothetical protein